MRIRSIKPEFWTHPVMARLEPEVQLLALALLSLADDEGYFRAEPELVRAACQPFTEDSGRITVALLTLSKVGWIEVFDTGETGLIGCVKNFRKHQVINKPRASKLKAYAVSEDSRSATVGLPEDYVGEQGAGKGKDSPIVPLSGDGGIENAERKTLNAEAQLVLVPEDGDPPPGNTAGQAGRQEIPVELQRARAMFRMRESTPLDMAHIRAWRRAHAVVKATTPEEWAVLEAYYSAELAKRDDFRRRDVVTCLNNWSGEVTRAHAWASASGFRVPEISAKKEKGDAGPDGWREALAELHPENQNAATVYADWRAVPDSLKEEVLALFEELARGQESPESGGLRAEDSDEGRAA
jgi:hypothetical protein